MKVEDYELNNSSGYEIPEKRKEELIKAIDNKIRKEHIALFEILKIAKDDDEINFIYQYLEENEITIRGINGTLSGELENYEHTPKMTQSIIPDELPRQKSEDELIEEDMVLEEIEPNKQEELFEKLRELREKLSDFKLTEEEKRGILKDYENVRNILIEGNMKLAKWVANCFPGIKEMKMETKDKEQAAMLGLIKAVDNFDCRFVTQKGNYAKFSTYACVAIAHTIKREYEEKYYSQLKVPIHAQQDFKFLKRVGNSLEEKLGRKPRIDEIAQMSNMPVRKVKELLELFSRVNMNSLEEEIEDANNIEKSFSNFRDGDRVAINDEHIYLDGIELEPEEIKIKDYYAFGSDEVNAQKIVEAVQGKKAIEETLSTLTPREQTVLRLRFGLKDGKARTLEEVGSEFAVTRERIRQIEAKAIRKLRHPNRSNKLKSVDSIPMETMEWYRILSKLKNIELEETKEIPETEKIEKKPIIEKIEEIPVTDKTEEIPETEKIEEKPVIDKIEEIPETEKIEEIPVTDKIEDLLGIEDAEELPEIEGEEDLPEIEDAEDLLEIEEEEELLEIEEEEDLLEIEGEEDLSEIEEEEELPEIEEAEDLSEEELDKMIDELERQKQENEISIEELPKIEETEELPKIKEGEDIPEIEETEELSEEELDKMIDELERKTQENEIEIEEIRRNIRKEKENKLKELMKKRQEQEKIIKQLSNQIKDIKK